MSPEKSTHQFFGEKTAYPIEELGASLQETVEKKIVEELRVAFLSNKFYLQQWVHLLPRMCNRKGLKRVYLTLMPPQVSQSVTAFYSKSSVAKFLSLLCGKQVVLTYIDSPKPTESSNERFFSSELYELPYDIITFFFNYDTDQVLKEKIQKLYSKAEKPILFFDLTAEDPVRKENDEIDKMVASEDDTVEKDDLGNFPIPGSREEYPYTAWQGTWKWEPRSDTTSITTFIGNRANEEDQKTILNFLLSS